jgi:hypothetical protein
MNLYNLLLKRREFMRAELFMKMWQEIKDFFQEKFKEYDAKWIERERKIDTRFLVLFILRLIIPKDNRGYANTLLEIFNNFLQFGIEQQPKTLAASSICEARMKLDPQIFKELSYGVVKIWNSYNETSHRWRGFKLYGIDGSKIRLPKELLRYGFKKEGEHTHYPQGLFSSAYDLLTGLPCDYSFVSHGDERMCALDHLKYTEERSLHIYDRGYFSFEMLAAHREAKKEAVFRLQTKLNIDVIDAFWDSSETDKEVLIPPTERFIKKVKKGLSWSLEPIRVRLIKYVIKDTVYVLLTTLLDQEKYPINSLKELYHYRWEHEEMLKLSKVITGFTDLHSKTEIGVTQEIFAHCLIVTLLKIIELQAQPQKEEEINDKKPNLRRLKRLNDNASSDNKKIEKSESWPSLRSGIQLNQRTIFLSLSWVLEKIFYLDSAIEKTVDYLINSAKKIYGMFRPNRAYERRSRTPPSKFWRARKA